MQMFYKKNLAAAFNVLSYLCILTKVAVVSFDLRSSSIVAIEGCFPSHNYDVWWLEMLDT